MTGRWGVGLAWGSCTDTGLRRRANEDSFIAEPPLFLVADGMGGHEGGAEASARAIASFRELAGRPADLDEVQRAFERAVQGVDEIETESFAAGTTLSGAVVCEQGGVPYWLIVNVGDSRTYRLIGGRLLQVSVDHSAVQVLIDRGEITEADAERHPQRSVITRALGAGSTATPDYWLLPIVNGERLLVCSDGLTKELGTDDIERVLVEEASPQAAATRLVHQALLHGGRDNVTVVVADATGVVAEDDDPTSDAELQDTRPTAGRQEGASDAHIQQG